jgi:hypothetical protein
VLSKYLGCYDKWMQIKQPRNVEQVSGKQQECVPTFVSVGSAHRKARMLEGEKW